MIHQKAANDPDNPRRNGEHHHRNHGKEYTSEKAKRNNQPARLPDDLENRRDIPERGETIAPGGQKRLSIFVHAMFSARSRNPIAIRKPMRVYPHPSLFV